MISSEESLKCAGCGGRLAPTMRYCPSCYQKVSTKGVTTVRHTESASEIATTHRPDPTVIFSPEAHEQIKRHAIKVKRLIISSLIVFSLFTVALYTFPHIKKYRADAKKAEDRFVQARKDMNMTAEALERFKKDMGRYPTKDEGIGVLVEMPITWAEHETALYKKWTGPYISSVREVDPWGNEYVYDPAKDGKEFKLISVDPLKDQDKSIRVIVTSRD